NWNLLKWFVGFRAAWFKSGASRIHRISPRPLFGLADERSILRGAKSDVHFGFVTDFFPGELQADRDHKRRLGETHLRRERVGRSPSPARRRRLLGESAPRHLAFLPGVAAAFDPPFRATDPGYQGEGPVVAPLGKGDRFQLPVVGGELVGLAGDVGGGAGADRPAQ